MLVAGPGTGSSVDELKEVETKIQMVKLEIEEKERQEQHQAGSTFNMHLTYHCLSHVFL